MKQFYVLFILAGLSIVLTQDLQSKTFCPMFMSDKCICIDGTETGASCPKTCKDACENHGGVLEIIPVS